MTLRITAILLAAAFSLPAGIIFSEDFENGVAIQSQTSGVLVGTQFQVVSGSVDVVTPDAPYASNCSTPTSGTCIDTTGGGGDGRGTIETINDIELAPGEYILSFDLIGWHYTRTNLNQKASVRVTFGDLFDEVYERDGALNPYETIIALLDVSAPTSAKLVFSTFKGSGFAGAILDNISIRTATETDVTATPEPGSMALLGLGGLLLVLRKKMARRKS